MAGPCSGGAHTHVTHGGSGAAALFIHGQLAQSQVWSRMLDGMSGLAWRAMDLPGHGQTALREGAKSYPDVASEAVAALLTERVHLVGHSFGAVVALRIAVERPQQVRSLALIDPVFFHAARQIDPHAYARYLADSSRVYDALERGEMDRAAQIFLGQWGVPGAWDAMGGRQRAQVTARMPLIAQSAGFLEHDSAQIWPRLDRLDMPALLVIGGQSAPIISPVAQALGGRLGCACHVIEQAGHMIPLTHPDELRPLVQEFLSAQGKHVPR